MILEILPLMFLTGFLTHDTLFYYYIMVDLSFVLLSFASGQRV